MPTRAALIEDFSLDDMRRAVALNAGTRSSTPAASAVMTTIAMGAGIVPIATGWGVDPSFRAPMAIVVIGGLITSTFLSLLVIPVAFTHMDDAAQLVFKRLRKPHHDQPAGGTREDLVEVAK